METTKRAMLILISILLTTGIAISMETKISDTLTASCLIKITSDPAILPLDDTTIDYLLHSSGVGGKAAKEILDTQLSKEALGEAIQIEWLADEGDMSRDLGSLPHETELYVEPENQTMRARGEMDEDIAGSRPRRSTGRRTISEPSDITNEQMILIRIAVNLQPDDILTEVKPAAEEFMNAAIDNLKAALTGAFDEHRQRLNGRLRLAEEEVSRTEQQLSDMQERLRSIAGSRILDKDNILNNIMNLRRELQDTKMEQDSDQVIVEAITNKIAETQAKLKEQLAKDEVTSEMQKIIENQRQQVEAAKQLVERGMAGRENLAEAENKLTRARIELAQRREQMGRSAGGDLIESLNRELADRSIQSAQNQVKINALNHQLAEAEELLNRADDYELLSLKADIAKQNLREAIIWRDRISRQDRLIQSPSVTVFGGE